MGTEKKKKLIIIGNGETALIAYEYFTLDSCYEVVAFAADREYIIDNILNGLPVVAIEDLIKTYPIEEYEAFCAVSSTKLNTVRKELYERTKALGYKLATYVNSRVYLPSPDKTSIGENCFILENTVIQPYAKIGNDVTIWGSGYVGHRSVIEDHCFLAGHVCIAGFVHFGESCYIAGNTSFANNINIGDHCLIGLGSIIAKDVEPYSIYKAKHSVKQKINTKQFYNL